MTATPSAPASRQARGVVGVDTAERVDGERPGGERRARRAARRGPCPPCSAAEHRRRARRRTRGSRATRVGALGDRAGARTSSSECAGTETQARAQQIARASFTVAGVAPEVHAVGADVAREAGVAVDDERRRPPRASRAAAARRRRAGSRAPACLSRSCTQSRPRGRPRATCSTHRTMASSPNTGSVTRMRRGATHPSVRRPAAAELRRAARAPAAAHRLAG